MSEYVSRHSLPCRVEAQMVNGGSKVRDDSERFGGHTSLTLFSFIEVNHSTIRATGNVLVVRGDGEVSTSETALISERVDTISCGHVPHIYFTITCGVCEKKGCKYVMHYDSLPVERRCRLSGEKVTSHTLPFIFRSAIHCLVCHHMKQCYHKSRPDQC